MADLNSIKKIINFTKDMLKDHLKKIIELCEKNNELNLININKQDNFEPFNIILASSDLYYRENYHSDILTYILNHKMEYIELFIKYLNNFEKNKINVMNYTNPIVTREENRIDILIKDNISKHSIIIENKINNAGDTFRQLPKYYTLLTDNDYKVDAIIYLSVDGSKQPNTSTWTKDDYKLGLENKITYCAVSNQTENDLINGFYNKCIIETEINQEYTFFKQYIDLLLYLRRKQMDNQLMENFYIQMQNNETYNTALSLRTMLYDLIEYRRNKLQDKYVNNHNPFMRIFPYSKDDLVFERIPVISSKENTKLDIIFSEKNTRIVFWIEETKIKADWIKIILDTLNFTEDFKKKENNEYEKYFLFPQEEEMFLTYLDNFLLLLNNNIELIKEKIHAKNDT